MEIIILCVIIAILSFILFIAIRKLVESLNKDSNNYYFNKMQGLDSKILEKQKELENIKGPEENEINKEKEQKEENDIDSKLLGSLMGTDYQNSNAFEIARDVDEIFDIDEEKIIKKFINKNINSKDYDLLMKIKDRFSPNLIYKLKSLKKENQIKEIGKMLEDSEYEVFSDYLKARKFKLERFLMDLDLMIEKYNPYIEILTGSKKKNYNSISPYIKTVYDESIYKGIIIKYQGNIYDYSINERDVN